MYNKCLAKSMQQAMAPSAAATVVEVLVEETKYTL
jgi:hypothetical protein